MPHVKQGGILVHAAREIHVPDREERATRRDQHEAQIQGHQAARSAMLSAVKPEQPSTNGLPSLKGLKSANHVHDVFKKR